MSEKFTEFTFRVNWIGDSFCMVIWEWKKRKKKPTPANSTEIANDLHGNLAQLCGYWNCFRRSWIK